MKKLKILNFFGHPVSLEINEKTQNKSYIGTFATFLILIIISYVFIDLTIQMYKREKPIVVKIEEKINQDTQYLNVKVIKQLLFNQQKAKLDDQFLVIFGMTDFDGKFIKREINYRILFNIWIGLCDVEIDSKTKEFEKDCISLDLVQCDEIQNIENIAEVFEQDKKYFFKESGLDENLARFGYCLKMPNGGLQLQGSESSLQSKRLEYRISTCHNEDCFTEEEQKILEGAILLVGVNYQKFSPKQQGNPFKNEIVYQKVYLQHGLNKPNLLFFLNKVQSYTIEDFFYVKENIQYDQGLEFNKVELYYQKDYSENDDILLTGGVFLSDTIITYQRSYRNILNVLGDIGGLLNILMLAGRLIVQPLEHLSFKISLFLQLYSLEQSNEKSEENQTIEKPSSRQIIPVEEHKVNPDFDEQGFSNIQLSQNLEEKIRKKIKSKQKLIGKNRSIKEILFNDALRNNVWKGKDKIATQLNLLELIRFKIQFNTYLDLTLNQDQKNLFYYISKQKYDISQEIPILEQSKLEKQQTQELARSYSALLYDGNEMNKKIVDKFNKTLGLSDQFFQKARQENIERLSNFQDYVREDIQQINA